MSQTLNYDNLVGDYARHRGIQPEVFKLLLKHGRIKPERRVLEVGCGTGNYICALQAASSCQAWGIDPSREMLAHAQGKRSPVNFSYGRGEAISLPDQWFDLVFSVDVIHHIQDRSQFYREAFRVLNRRGKICTVTESSWMIHTRRPFSQYFPETVPVDLGRYPGHLELRELMMSAGFLRIYGCLAEYSFMVDQIQDFRDKAYSCLHLISPEGFRDGLERMEQDLRAGPLTWVSRYLLLWGSKPDRE